jgi:hypothetical protein
LLRLEEAESTAHLGMNHVDTNCRPVPQRPAEVLSVALPQAMRVTGRLRAGLAPKL